MNRTALLWKDPPPDWRRRLDACVTDAAAAMSGTTRVYFRADDVAVPGRRLASLMDLFIRHGTPLAMAVVPAWLTRPRWETIAAIGRPSRHLWCWHQHGWRHHNHEPEGKKQEFGPSRLVGDLRRDVDRGRRRLQSIMGSDFFPVFTPPWNRCSDLTLDYLERSGYRAVSRSRHSLPPAPRGIPDLFMGVDLHTRRDPTPQAGWQRLLAELFENLTQPSCGIMIHHRLMNSAAFECLDQLLALIHRHGRMEKRSFPSLCPR
ncbi:MAG: hypothetical protein PVH30_01145 [Desulfobacterales bacterium]